MKNSILMFMPLLAAASVAQADDYLGQCGDLLARPYQLPGLIAELESDNNTIYAVAGDAVVFPNVMDAADYADDIYDCLQEVDGVAADERVAKMYRVQNAIEIAEQDYTLKFDGADYMQISDLVAKQSLQRSGVVTIADNVTPGQCLTVDSEQLSQTINIRVDGDAVACTGDFDANGQVNIGDFLDIVNNRGGNDQQYDLNCDGIVDNLDIDIFENRFNTSCQAQHVRQKLQLCRADVDGNGSVDTGDFLEMLSVMGSSHSLYDLDGSGVVDSLDSDILQAEFGADCIVENKIDKVAVITVDLAADLYTEEEITSLVTKFDNYMYKLTTSGSNRMHSWSKGQVTYTRDNDLDGAMDYLGNVTRLDGGRACDRHFISEIAKEQFPNFEEYDTVMYLFSDSYACFFNARISDEFVLNPDVQRSVIYKTGWLLNDDIRDGEAFANHIVSHELAHFLTAGHSDIANRADRTTPGSLYSALGDNRTNFDYLDFPNLLQVQRFQGVGMDYYERELEGLNETFTIADIYDIAQGGKKGIHLPQAKLDTVYSASTNFRPRDYFVSYSRKVNDNTPVVFIHTGSDAIKFGGSVLLDELNLGESYVDVNNKIAVHFEAVNEGRASIKVYKTSGAPLTNCSLPLRSDVVFDFSNVVYNSEQQTASIDYTVFTEDLATYDCQMGKEFVLRVIMQNVANETSTLGPVKHQQDFQLNHDVTNGQVAMGTITVPVPVDELTNPYLLLTIYAWRPKTNSDQGYIEYSFVKRSGDSRPRLVVPEQ